MRKKFIDLFTAKIFEENIKDFSDYKQIYQMYLNYEKQLKMKKTILESYMRVIAIGEVCALAFSDDDLIRFSKVEKRFNTIMKNILSGIDNGGLNK